MYKRLMLITVLLLCAGKLVATEVNLYQADIGTERENNRITPQEARRALAQVLVRITGQPDILQRTDVQQALAGAANMVFRFRYYRPETETSAATPVRLEVGFDPDAVLALVKRLSLPWWDANRPELLWVTVLDLQGTRILATLENLPALDELQRISQQLGLPLTLPLLDLEDQRALSPRLLWGGFTDGLEPVRQRYEADGWVVLRLESGPPLWRARWQLSLPLWQPPLRRQWQDVDSELPTLLARVLEQVTRVLARRQAIVLGENRSGPLAIVVHGLYRLDHWLRLERWLETQPWSEQVQLQALHQGQATVLLHITTQAEAVLGALRESGLVQPAPDQRPEGEAGLTHWQWSGP